MVCVGNYVNDYHIYRGICNTFEDNVREVDSSMIKWGFYTRKAVKAHDRIQQRVDEDWQLWSNILRILLLRQQS